MNTKYLIDASQDEPIEKVVFSNGNSLEYGYPATSIEVDGDNLVMMDKDEDSVATIQGEDVDRLIEALTILKETINL